MTNDRLEKLKSPAIGLLIAGIVNLLFGIYIVVSGLVKMQLGMVSAKGATDEERTAFLVGYWGIVILGGLGALAAPVIIYGAFSMLKGVRYRSAKAAAILAIIPAVSCFFIIGIPFGIWALKTLRKPDVRAAFSEETPAA
jgi:hypothetical protein